MNASNAAQPLQGQTALVVQSNAGIGAAVAEAFAVAGAKVMLNYLNGNEAADQVAQRIRAKQGQAMIFQADVSQESQVKSMFDVLVVYWGGLDILVTNVNLEIDDSVVDINREQWQKILIQNLTGQFLCVREAMREFSRQCFQSESPNSSGNIICVSSLRDALCSSGLINYTVCKADMSKLFKTVTSELGQENTNIDLYSANGPSLAEYWYANQALAIASDSATLTSRNQEYIAKAAVDLAAAAYVDGVMIDEFGQIQIGSESATFE
jgi:NAD(P)-dependent dehydrogenase (short-subunit alcohol dehydrogenase family)